MTEAGDATTGRPKVFGVGYMKTGTSTLGACFSVLGLRHQPYHPILIRQHRRADSEPLWDAVEKCESFEDHPWPDVFRELDDRYPDAKFILTTRRSSEKWFDSLASHAKRRGPTAERYLIFGHGWPNAGRDEHIEQYETHNQAVRNHFADRPGKLLDVCWETGSTWADVAEFLGLDSLDAAPAPNHNAAADQRIQPVAWLRNTVKYVLIGRLNIDPWRRRDRPS